MALNTIFANLPTGNNAAALIDTNFNQVGAMAVTACTATGVTTISLSPNANQPTVSSYANYQLFGFVAIATCGASPTGNINGLGALNIYKQNGATAGAGDIVSGVYYILAYNSALNSNTGGLQLVSSNPSFFQYSVFTSTGTFTTPPTSSTSTIYQYVIIAGGGGGGGANGAAAAAGGGGSGETAQGTFTGVAASTPITITVGAAGAAGASSGGTGGTGGVSSIGSPVSIVANAGVGGVGSGAAGAAGGTGGTGGTGSAGFRISGQHGGNGLSATSIALAGAGGSTPLGLGGVGGTIGVNANPGASTGFGAGGGGAAVGPTAPGGVGTAGIIIITQMTP